MKRIILVFALVALLSAFSIRKESTEIDIIRDPTECIKTNCPNEYNACQNDSKCPPVLQKCQDKCNTDQNCWKNCLASNYNQNAINVAKCAAAHNCLSLKEELSTALATIEVDPTQCIKDKCPTQYAACQKDSKCPSTLEACEKKCNTDQNCWKWCLVGAGDQPAIDVAKCAAANHCLGLEEELSTALATIEVDPTQCIKDKCPTQYAACQKDSKCPSTLEACEKKCNTDQNCWKWCLVGAGDQPAIDVAKCAAANHCLGLEEELSTALATIEDPTECIKTNCPNEYNACQNDSKCPPVLQKCQDKCNTDQNCWKNCLASNYNQNAINVAKCAAANHCLGLEEELSTALATIEVDPTQCIKDKCPTQYAACQKDSKCPSTLEACEKKCNTDQNCWKWCLVGAGDQPAIDVAKCAAANHCLGLEEELSTALATIEDPTECIKTNCPNEYNACQNDSKCPPVLQKCQDKCNTDQNCWKNCLASNYNQNAINVAKCAAAHNCLSLKEELSTALATIEVDPTQCIKDKCPTQYAACQKDSKCPSTLEACEKKCNTDQNCWKWCLVGAGDQPAIDVAKCAAANHCLGLEEELSTALATIEVDPTQCIKDKCPTQYAACQKDSKCPSTLEACEKKCNTDQNCWKWCLVGAGDQPAIDVAKCAAANHCLGLEEELSTALATIEDPTECIKTNCPNEYNACQNDSKCPPVLQKCQDKCNTDQNCWKNCLASNYNKNAINVAKCAAAHNCLSTEVEVYGFEVCMSKTCELQFNGCLGDKLCRLFLLKCRIPERMWEFNHECLIEKSAFHPKIAQFYTCAGENKCL